eukprot:508549_1
MSSSFVEKLSNPRMAINPLEISQNSSDQKDEETMKPITLHNEIFELLQLAWPVTITTIVEGSQYIIGNAFLGHLGTAQLDGSAMAFICIELIDTFLRSTATGLNSLCSQAIGAGNPSLAGNWLQLSLAVGAIMFVPSFIILFFVKDIISPFEHNQDVQKYASIYAKFATFSLVPIFIYMAITQYFQALQIVRPATVVSVLAIAINISLNQILIHGLPILQFNGFGFKGAPIATTCSATLQLIIFYLYSIVYRKYPIKSNAWGGWSVKSFQWNRIKNFFKIIIPIMIGDASENWSLQVMVIIFGSLSENDVAANVVMFDLWYVLWSVFWGIGLAITVRSGKAISNGDVLGTKLIMKISLFFSFVVNGIISILCYLLRRNVSKIYTSNDDVIEILEHAIPILAMLYLIGGIAWSARSMMEGMSRNIERSYVYFITSWVIFIPGAIYFGIYCKWNKQHKWSTICLIWYWALFVEIIRCVWIWVILLNTDWNKQVVLAKERSEAVDKEADKIEIRTLLGNDGVNVIQTDTDLSDT